MKKSFKKKEEKKRFQISDKRRTGKRKWDFKNNKTSNTKDIKKTDP